ncbi:MAG: hypothetical protein CMF72_22755 [Mameliella sp.]|nr:hypothetical protein [Mameliella sp.]|tara:strand:+ start:2075 stop:2263 length:189 start_codon:yes stop_codon:yes gene_type:complete
MTGRFLLNLVLLALASIGSASVTVVVIMPGVPFADRALAIGFLCFFLAMGASAVRHLMRTEP